MVIISSVVVSPIPVVAGFNNYHPGLTVPVNFFYLTGRIMCRVPGWIGAPIWVRIIWIIPSFRITAAAAARCKCYQHNCGNNH